MDGTFINLVEQVLAIAITQKPSIVTPQEAKYLRRHLGLTQERLAERMGVARETLAHWETGATPISPHQDFILRTVAIASFGSNRAGGLKPIPASLRDEVMSSLTGVRSMHAEPGEELDPHLVQSLIEKLQHRGSHHTTKRR